jgi:hypothetical protein
MKLILSAIIALAAQTSFASNVTYLWPEVNGLAINNACATATTFRSLQPITYCSETKVVARYACVYGEAEYCRKLKAGENPIGNETLREEYGCVSYSSQHKEVSRKVISQECKKWGPGFGDYAPNECLKWETKETFVGLTFKVQRMKDYGGEAGLVFDGTEDFTVPMCPAKGN